MKTIRNFDLNDKKVIIRCDFNVPIVDGKITDDSRIRKSLKTIKYALEKGAKVILLSHLGRVKTEDDLKKYNLKPVSERLSELLEMEVVFCEETRGRHLKYLVRKLNKGEVLLVQNTRYEDLEENKESKNNTELGKYWSSLGDIFINDAFATAHRKHASNNKIAKYLPSGIGFLMEEEIRLLNKITKNPDKPYIVILGGCKISDKLKMVENLVKKADFVLVGGAMAFTFLKAAGFNIGHSLYERELIDFCTELLSEYEGKIVLPTDIVVAEEIKENAKTAIKFINEIDENEIGLDIGPSSLKVFSHYIKEGKTIFYNGPVGYLEIADFANGTKEIFKMLSKNKGTTIIGGGDTASGALNMGFSDSFTHISTGGGASLKYLEEHTLPAIEIINEKNL